MLLEHILISFSAFEEPLTTNHSTNQPTKQTTICETEFQFLLYIFSNSHSARCEEIFHYKLMFSLFINNVEHPYIEF